MDAEKYQKDFGRVIREMREDKGVSETVMAEAIGYNQTSLSRVERGIQWPSQKILFKIADYLETTLGHIYAQVERLTIVEDNDQAFLLKAYQKIAGGKSEPPEGSK